MTHHHELMILACSVNSYVYQVLYNAKDSKLVGASDSFYYLNACKRDWQLYRPGNLEELWEHITDEVYQQDERLPYWVELWPASLALAELQEKNSVFLQGKNCLDIGCGLGFTALTGAHLGARVIAMDYEYAAVSVAQKNALLNNISGVQWLTMDWRFPAIAPMSIDCIWGGDIMYEQRFVAPVCSFLDHCLCPGGIVWIAEPNRNIFSSFIHHITSLGWQANSLASIPVSLPASAAVPVSVSIWQLTKGLHT